jgi:hypothetical protein
MPPDDFTAAHIRRIVANPDDESAWAAYAADLGDNGHDRPSVFCSRSRPATSHKAPVPIPDSERVGNTSPLAPTLGGA